MMMKLKIGKVDGQWLVKLMDPQEGASNIWVGMFGDWKTALKHGCVAYRFYL